MLRKFLFVVLTMLCVLVAVAGYFYTAARQGALEALTEGSQIIETSAGLMEFRVVGESGPVLLYASPAGYDSRPPLQGNYRIVIPSRPGYLATPLASGATPADQALAYAALLDELDIDSVIVLTVSAGAPSALSFAALFPQRTRALIAVAPASRQFQATELPGFLQSDFNYWALFNIIDWLGDETRVNLLVPHQAGRQLIMADPDKVARTADVIWSFWPVSRRLQGSKNDAQQFRQMALPLVEITAPVLIIHGSEDATVPFSHSQLLAGAIPGARLLTIEDGDHMMILSHADDIERAIERFIDEISAN